MRQGLVTAGQAVLAWGAPEAQTSDAKILWKSSHPYPMSKESFSDAGSDAGPDAPGALSGGAAERSDGAAKQRFEAYLVECVERLFTEIGTRLSNSLQQTLGRLVNVQSRSIDVLEKLEAEQRYMRAQIERLSADIALLRRGSMTPPVPRGRRAWTHRHRRLFVASRPRLPKD
jgi:hypothetical protein